MTHMPKNRLRTPEEVIGTLAHTDLPPPANHAPEAHFVRALRDRDEAAFETLIARYYNPMLRVAISYVRTREEAEEVVQDTWLAVLQGIDRFEGRSSLRTWIFRILINRARTRARREARSLPFSALRSVAGDRNDRVGAGAGGTDIDALLTHATTEGSRAELLPGAPPPPDARVLADELLRRLESGLADLPPRQQEVVRLRDMEGWSADEVCEELSVSAVNQRVLLHRARSRLRGSLGDYLLDPPLTGAAG